MNQTARSSLPADPDLSFGRKWAAKGKQRDVPKIPDKGFYCSAGKSSLLETFKVMDFQVAVGRLSDVVVHFLYPFGIAFFTRNPSIPRLPFIPRRSDELPSIPISPFYKSHHKRYLIPFWRRCLPQTAAILPVRTCSRKEFVHVHGVGGKVLPDGGTDSLFVINTRDIIFHDN